MVAIGHAPEKDEPRWGGASDGSRAARRHEHVSPTWRVLARTGFPFVVVAAIWEALAHAGLFPARLFPPVQDVIATLVRLTVAGILPHHAFDTVLHLTGGFALAAVTGVAIGIAMGRWRFAEDVFLPLVSIGAPIPGLAYAPLFLLWFGLGNLSAVLLVGFVATFPIIFNTWTGVKAVKEIWVRAAQAMGPMIGGCSATSSCRARSLTFSPVCGSGSPRRGAFWSGSRCSRPCSGD